MASPHGVLQPPVGPRGPYATHRCLRLRGRLSKAAHTVRRRANMLHSPGTCSHDTLARVLPSSSYPSIWHRRSLAAKADSQRPNSALPSSLSASSSYRCSHLCGLLFGGNPGGAAVGCATGLGLVLGMLGSTSFLHANSSGRGSIVHGGTDADGSRAQSVVTTTRDPISNCCLSDIRSASEQPRTGRAFTGRLMLEVVVKKLE